MANSVWITAGSFTNNGTTINPLLTIGLLDGSGNSPSLTFASDASNNQSGIFKPATAYLGFAAGGVVGLAVVNDGATFGTRMRSDAQFGWSSNTSVTTSSDTLLTRQSAGVVNVNTGYAAGGTTGVASFGPADATSFTVKGGIITAIS